MHAPMLQAAIPAIVCSIRFARLAFRMCHIEFEKVMPTPFVRTNPVRGIGRLIASEFGVPMRREVVASSTRNVTGGFLGWKRFCLFGIARRARIQLNGLFISLAEPDWRLFGVQSPHSDRGSSWGEAWTTSPRWR